MAEEISIEVSPETQVIGVEVIERGERGQDGISGRDGHYTVSDTAPLDPVEGDGWFNSSNAQTFIYYDGFWVEQVGNPPVSDFNLSGSIHAATEKTTLDSSDEFGFWDSISNGLRKITWSNFKSLLDSLYASLTHNHVISTLTGYFNTTRHKILTGTVTEALTEIGAAMASESKTASFTAVKGGRYHVTGSATADGSVVVTDPTSPAPAAHQHRS